MPTRAQVRRIAASRLRNTGALTTIAGRRLSRRDLQLLGMTLEAPTIPAPKPATEDDAMGLPPYGQAVALIANALASTNWFARRFNRDDGIWERLPDQPSIVTNTSPLQTMWAYKWAYAVDVINWGNHFGLLGEIDWRTGRPGWIIPLPADEMWIITDPARPGWYEWAIGGQTFDADEIFHVASGARSGMILGRGAIEQYASWLPGPIAAEEYARQQFAAGALPPAVITTNQATTEKQGQDLKALWRTLVTQGEPVILPNGTELKPVVGNAVNAQMVEARQWGAQEAAWVVGVPGWKMGLQGPSMTYQNVEDADIDFVRDYVDRWARPLSEAVTKWLLQAGVELEWDYDSRMRADAKGKAEVVTTLKSANIYDETEARARYDLPPRRSPQTPAVDAGAGGTIDAAPQPTTDAATQLLNSTPTGLRGETTP